MQARPQCYRKSQCGKQSDSRDMAGRHNDSMLTRALARAVVIKRSEDRMDIAGQQSASSQQVKRRIFSTGLRRQEGTTATGECGCQPEPLVGALFQKAGSQKSLVAELLA